MTIGKKISLTSAVLVGLAIISNAVALFSVSRINENLKAVVGDSLPGVYLSGHVLALFKDQRIAMLEHILSTDDAQQAQSQRTIAEVEEKIKETLNEYEKTATAGRNREIYESVGPAHESLLQVWSKVLKLDSEKKDKEAFQIWSSELVPAAKVQIKAITDLTEFDKSDGNIHADAATKSATTATWLGWLMMAIAVCSGSLMAFFGVRSVSRALNRTVSELAEGAEQITSASSQVASSSQALAQGASEQAASLEETSASSEEITSMTRKNAENSQSAAAMMDEVDHRISEGNRTLAQMVTSMREITSSSDKISKIIKVIDEIAFQTNILALNAAVEAARAGEAGMGFAVVADEVRNLAQRSAQAAKDTAALIEESIGKSNEGSTKLQQVTAVIEAITESAAKVKTLVDEVNLGSQEQARGIEQISKAIAQMDQVTQSTAANAEESASASEEMSAQAEALNHIVVELRSLVGGDGAGLISRAAPARKTVSKPLTKSLTALKSAVSQRVRKPVQAAVPAGSHAEFPMDDNFTEM